MNRPASGLAKEVAVVLWVCLGSWYYGYHISELNFPAPSLMCSASPGSATSSSILPFLPPCILPGIGSYSLVTAAFNFGGLLGSISSAKVLERRGWRGTILLMGLMNGAGALLMGFSTHWILLGLGRFLSGLSSGLAVCIVPPLLSLLARSSVHPLLTNHIGSIGILNQLGIVLGILSAQLSGLAFTGLQGEQRGGWRAVVLLSGGMSALQLGAGLFGLLKEGEVEQREASKADRAKHYARISADPETSGADAVDGEQSPLLRSDFDTSRAASPLPGAVTPVHTISSLISDRAVRPSLLLVCFILGAQQLSGVNAVLFYSTPVLKRLIPGSAGLIGVGVSFVNVLMTFPPLFLVDRVGRKTIFQLSLIGMMINSILLKIGLDSHHQTLSAIAIVLFVASFAAGAGPVPFLLISELVPAHAVPATASLALSISWVMSFGIASAFLPLRNLLASGAGEGEGRVFLVFFACQLVTVLVVQRYLYKTG